MNINVFYSVIKNGTLLYIQASVSWMKKCSNTYVKYFIMTYFLKKKRIHWVSRLAKTDFLFQIVFSGRDYYPYTISNPEISGLKKNENIFNIIMLTSKN